MHSIGEMARLAGVPVSTVRYYERKGLLAPDGRSVSNYRIYSARGLARLRFILAAKRIGFTLSDIARLLSLRDGEGACCGDVSRVIEQRLARIQERMADLEHARTVLGKALTFCRDNPDGDGCPVLDDLTRDGGD